ncbi:hypothetical protein A9Q81_25730 [Gammaproteobacteria bacterium 42_54_T18]|nr:hypothetical protein A9Q81_25730 [Gammaproteobacteria bacterium 42_54_T18]
MQRSKQRYPGFLILAAGQGRRFGGNKLTAMLDNKPVIQHCLDTLTTLDHPVAIVYEHDNTELSRCISAYRIHKIPFDAAHLGMGASLAYGIEQTKDWNGWVICLGDMPWILLSTYQNIANKLHNHVIVRPTTPTISPPQISGHPVGFQQRFKQELLALTGDKGAKCIISRHKDMLYSMETSDYGIVLDIDRPSDLNRPP